MKTTYFKTVKAFYKAIADAKYNDLKVDVCACSCQCGEVNGSYVYKNDKLIGKFILCETCYNNASKKEQGE